MTPRRLLWGMTWRGGIWGLVAGGILGTLYGLASLVFIFSPATLNSGQLDPKSFVISLAFLGASLGALAGLLGGIFGGLFVGILTYSFFKPLKNPVRYRWVIGISIALSTGMIVLSCFLTIYILLTGTTFISEFSLLLYFVLIPALIAGMAAGLIGQRLARWYERESAKGITQNVASN